MVNNPPANAGNPRLIPELGRSPGGGHANSLHYCCLGNPMDRGDWRGAASGAAESDTAKHSTFLLKLI